MIEAITSHSQSGRLGGNALRDEGYLQGADLRAENPETPAGCPDSPGGLSALLRILPDAILVIRSDGLILECHPPSDPAAAKRFEGLLGRNYHDVLSQPACKAIGYYLDQALHSHQIQKFTFGREHQGEHREYRVHLVECGPDQVLALIRDSTFEKLREKEIVEITSREQTRIGQDLHDGLGQQLTGISFLSRALEQKLAARGLPEAAEAAEICRLVLQTLSQTRNLARGLFPVELEGSGLIRALKELGCEIEKLFHISCLVECDNDLVVRDRPVANHLFRLAQEAISNSVKHGKARRVAVRLERLSGAATLSISDDGIGFRDNTVPGQGLGMRIMNYRAQKVGGTLDVRSAPSGGVHVRCTFPTTQLIDSTA